MPVRFPIKPKKAEERTLGKKSALPVESSSDSDNEPEDANQSTSANGQQGRSSIPPVVPYGSGAPSQSGMFSELQQYSGGAQGLGIQQYVEEEEEYGRQGWGYGDIDIGEDIDDDGSMNAGKAYSKAGGKISH